MGVSSTPTTSSFYARAGALGVLVYRSALCVQVSDIGARPPSGGRPASIKSRKSGGKPRCGASNWCTSKTEHLIRLFEPISTRIDAFPEPRRCCLAASSRCTSSSISSCIAYLLQTFCISSRMCNPCVASVAGI
jgi:hypothetical protein